jgi:hypothetical protein
MNNKPCQSLDLLAASSSSRFYVLVNQTLEYMELYGPWAALRQIVSWLVLRTLRLLGLSEKAKTAHEASPDEILDLRPGELVEVRSKEEILKTLDDHRRHRGLGFSTEMEEYCGRRLRVLKRVDRFILESYPGKVRRLRQTVILEGALCKGLGIGCDRSCFHFWREAWLKRVRGTQ